MKGSLGLFQSGLQITDQRKHIHAEDIRDLQKLNNIQAPFARFVFSNERLRLAQLVGQLLLRDVGAFAFLDESLHEMSIGIGENRFGHARLTIV